MPGQLAGLETGFSLKTSCKRKGRAKMRLLLVEDEKSLADSLAYLLKSQRYQVDVAYDGVAGLELALEKAYDLIILDRMLPKKNGIEVLRELRELQFEIPVLMVTARDTVQDRVQGLDAGADDYLLKPFATEELLARVRALTRRGQAPLQESEMATASFRFTPAKGEVVQGGEVIRLTPTESSLLELLLRNANNVVTKEIIMERIWGYASDIEPGNIDLYIHYLRKKLQTTSIRTIRSKGYMWEE
jgi:DNA-binding response OmpR family regulator